MWPVRYAAALARVLWCWAKHKHYRLCRPRQARHGAAYYCPTCLALR